MQFHDGFSLSQLIFSEFFLDLGLGIHLSDRLESGFDQIRRIAGTQGFRQNVDHAGETEDGTEGAARDQSGSKRDDYSFSP